MCLGDDSVPRHLGDRHDECFKNRCVLGGRGAIEHMDDDVENGRCRWKVDNFFTVSGMR